MWTSIYEWCVVWCGSKEGHQKDMCRIKIGLRAQKYVDHPRLNSQHDFSETYNDEHKNLHFNTEEDIRMSFEN